MIISLLRKLIERYGATEESNCRESRKHIPCVVGCGTKPETILLKSLGSFPCPFWLSFSCSYLMDQASWNSCNLLSFVGQVMISGTQLENHTVEEFPTQILKHGKKGFVFSAPLVRGKVTEIEINHQWPMIQSISLFIETSVQSV